MDAINSKRVSTLHPKLQPLVEKFLKLCDEYGYKVRITQVGRTIEEQNDLYAQGRTKPGQIVTKAKGGDSYHNYNLAVDFAPLNGGKINWNDEALFRKIGTLGVTAGLEWGGNFKSFKDLPHLQYPVALSTLKELHKNNKYTNGFINI